MRRLAELLTDLANAPHRKARMRRLTAFFAEEPDLGWAAAWLAGALKPPRQSADTLRAMAEARVDPTLFRISAAQIGDIGETTALIWPGEGDLRLSDVATWTLPLLELLDRLEAEARVAVIRLHIHRKPRGVRAVEVHEAIGQVFGADPMLIAGAMIQEAPPYPHMTAWLKGQGAAPNWAPPRPPELPRVETPSGPFQAWRLPQGEPVRVENGRAFDQNGAERRLKSATEDGWGFWIAGRVLFPTDMPPVSDPQAARGMGSTLLIKDADNQWAIWPAVPRSVICPVTYIDSARVIAVTLGVLNGEDIAPLIKLPAPDADKVSAFAREAVIDKFGPVRQVQPGLWAELSYEDIIQAPRRKIGIMLNGARITRLIWGDGPPTPSLTDLK